MGYTHVLMGLGLAFLVFGKRATIPILAMAYLGSVVPDFDLKYKHRKLLHNIFAMSFMSFVMGWSFGSPTYAEAFALGYAMHLLLDALTVGGVWLLWPVSRKAVKMGLCKSSSPLANTLLSALGLILIVYGLVLRGGL